MPRRRNKYPLWIIPLAVLVVLAIAAVSQNMPACSGPAVSSAENFADAQCLQSVVTPDELNEVMLRDYEGFTVSFNTAHHQPNYVAWELTAEEASGQLPREGKFRKDDNVLGSATSDDYRNSGYDRGHMAPAGDLKWSRKAMEDSHYMTNISPQTHALNGGRWSTLEKKCRTWAARDSSLIIICGPVLSDELSRTIGETGVSVPERFFKVILAPYTNPPAAIGFIMPNSESIAGLEQLATSVDRVEQITGFDFFECLPDSIEDAVEAQCNFRYWNRKY